MDEIVQHPANPAELRLQAFHGYSSACPNGTDIIKTSS